MFINIFLFINMEPLSDEYNRVLYLAFARMLVTVFHRHERSEGPLHDLVHRGMNVHGFLDDLCALRGRIHDIDDFLDQYRSLWADDVGT